MYYIIIVHLSFEEATASMRRITKSWGFPIQPARPPENFLGGRFIVVFRKEVLFFKSLNNSTLGFIGVDFSYYKRRYSS
jgi:hypothetical protein